MKTATARDLMVKRVQEAHKKWPSFDKMPELTEPAQVKVLVNCAGEKPEDKDYVAALYDLCSHGAIPAGRYKGELPIIGGNLPKEK